MTRRLNNNRQWADKTLQPQGRHSPLQLCQWEEEIRKKIPQDRDRGGTEHNAQKNSFQTADSGKNQRSSPALWVRSFHNTCPTGPPLMSNGCVSLFYLSKWNCSFWWTLGMDTRRRQWHPTPVLLPGKSHGLRSLVGCSPWGREDSDTTERLHFHFSLSCIREGNGNPLQCSCLENPRDRGAWWAAVYGVTQSQTRLKWLRSSSSSRDGH